MSGRGNERRRRQRRKGPPPRTARRVRTITKVVVNKIPDSTVDIMLATGNCKVFPHQTFTLQVEGLGDWNNMSQPLTGKHRPSLIGKCKDYITQNFMIHDITVYTPRLITRDTGPAQVFGVMADQVIHFNGNFVDIYTLTAAQDEMCDLVYMEVQPMMNLGRNKITYYLSKKLWNTMWD